MAQLHNIPSSHWRVECDFLPMLHGADDYLHQAHRDQAANAATLTPMGMDGATCVPCRKCLALILRLANVAEPSTATELAK